MDADSQLEILVRCQTMLGVLEKKCERLEEANRSSDLVSTERHGRLKAMEGSIERLGKCFDLSSQRTWDVGKSLIVPLIVAVLSVILTLGITNFFGPAKP